MFLDLSLLEQGVLELSADIVYNFNEIDKLYFSLNNPPNTRPVVIRILQMGWEFFYIYFIHPESSSVP